MHYNVAALDIKFDIANIDCKIKDLLPDLANILKLRTKWFVKLYRIVVDFFPLI